MSFSDEIKRFADDTKAKLGDEIANDGYRRVEVIVR